MADMTGTQLTYLGQELMAKCFEGKVLHISRVALGKGELADDVNPRTLTALIDETLRLPIDHVNNTGNGTVVIETELKNETVKQGFFAREVGVFATDPDTGVEILYAYANTGRDSTYIPASGGSQVLEILYDIVAVVDQCENITATIDGNISYVNRVDYNEHVYSTHPHPNAPSLSDAVSTTHDFWVTDNDNHLHKLDYESARRLILGGDSTTLPLMGSRIAQLENNLNNVLLEMVGNEEAPDSNLLIAEDFENPDMIDTYKVKVTSCVAGDRGIDVETDAGVIAGSWYWISDGMQQEYIQVKSVIRNGEVYRLLATDNLQYTYNIPNTYMYRTTSQIVQGIAYGSGDKKGFGWNPTTLWRGINANVASTIELETNQKNADAFTIDGEGAFSIDGMFTLA